MINLKTFFKNHFDTKEISDDNIRKFTLDNLQRMIANNVNNILDAITNATVDAYDEYFGAITDEDTAFALQQGRTKTVDDITEAFKDAVSRQEGLVDSKFGKGSSEYEEFFPQGITEYRTATRQNMPTLTNRMAVTALKYAAQLGDEFVQIFVDFNTNYIAARKTQLEQKGLVSGDKSQTADNRDVVEIQLMKNLLFTASLHVGEPEKLSVYFDQSIVRRPEDGEEEEPEPPPIEP